MTSLNDDRFRQPGGRYEHDEPVALAVVGRGQLIDWSDEAHSPMSIVWLPETLFEKMARGTRLASVNVYEQTFLDHWQCRALSNELAAVEAKATDLDIQVATGLVRALADRVAVSGDGEELLVEGP